MSRKIAVPGKDGNLYIPYENRKNGVSEQGNTWKLDRTGQGKLSSGHVLIVFRSESEPLLQIIANKRNRSESCVRTGRGTTASSVFCLTAPLSRIVAASAPTI